MTQTEFDQGLAIFEAKRLEILNEKAGIDARLAAIKTEIANARARFGATGVPAGRDWYTMMEKKQRELGASSQLLQRHLAELTIKRKEFNREHYGETRITAASKYFKLKEAINLADKTAGKKHSVFRGIVLAALEELEREE